LARASATANSRSSSTGNNHRLPSTFLFETL
jgi:hypothetical protein